MKSQSEVIKRIEAQDLINRFRSKDDLYRYLTGQNVAKLDFQEQFSKKKRKKAFKINEINFMEVPNYPEISVKNLYDDAMQDEDVEIYLPTREKLSNKLPQQKESFSLEFQETVKPDYLSEIIQEAHKKRFSIYSVDLKKQGILISDSWLEELKKYPYLPKNAVTGIFLMKEHAKVYRSRKSQQSHNVSKRLSEKRINPDEMNIDAGSESKSRKVILQEQIEKVKVRMRNPFLQDKLYCTYSLTQRKTFYSTLIFPRLALVIVFSLFALIVALTIKDTVSISKSFIK